MRARDTTRLLLLLIFGSIVSTVASAQTISAQAEKLFEKVTGDLTAEQRRAVERIRSRASTVDLEIVKAGARVLGTADIIDLSVDPLFKKELRTRVKVDTDQDSFRWFGTGEGGDGSSATFTVTKDIVGGSIFTDKHYSVEPIGGGLNAFVTLDPSKFPPDHPASAGQPPQGQPRTRSAGAPAATTSPVAIDVLVVLAKGAAALFPTEAERLNWVDRSIAATNLSYFNSGMAIELRRSPSSPYLVNYEETGFTTDLELLKSDSDSHMNDVHSVRASDKADVVVLIVASASGFCGRAYTTMASKDTAFAMVSAHCPIETLAFAHEIGHLQGASHNDEPGFFPHGHGHCKPSGEGTVMASRLTCPNRKPLWSHPPVWGSAPREHNARVLTETAPAIAAFLP